MNAQTTSTTTETLTAEKLDRMKEKIALLLNKAENTNFPAEAQTFQEHAERLMVRYGIAKAQLEDTEAKRGKRQEPVIEATFHVYGMYRLGRAIGLHAVAQAFPAVSTLESSDHNSKIIYVIGHESDVNTVLALFGSLLAQMEVAVADWWKTAPKDHLYSESMRRMERRQFQVSFLNQVARRVASLYREEQAETTGSELVFVGRQERVSNYIAEAYPSLRTSRSRLGSGSSLAASAGRAAGSRADVGNGRKVDAKRQGALV